MAGIRSFEGRVALVTGAGSGIGRATASAFAERGARLVVCDVSTEGLASLGSELGDAILLSEQVDVSNAGAMEAFANEVHAEVEAVDVLVNNAGVGLGGGVLDLRLEDWDWILGINLRGVVLGCHHFVPNMAKRGSGHVVNLSSVMGYFATPGSVAYVTTKFAVLGLSHAMRADLAPEGVGVSAICPGVISTGIIRATRFRGDADANVVRANMDKMYKRRAYGPEKVARAILRAVERNRAVVPVSPESWAIYYLQRFVPWLVPGLGRAMAKAAQS